MNDPFAKVCLGCPERCELISSAILRGCVYDDSPYPKDADLWVDARVAGDPEKIAGMKRYIKLTHPEAWKAENPNDQ